MGVRGGYEKVTSAFIFLGKTLFSRSKIFVVGENVRPTYIYAFILKGCPKSVGPRLAQKGTTDPKLP